jgi:hypothetical protein
MRPGMEDRLVLTGAYRDLEEPVIVTSGEFLTPFYVNAERLAGEPDMERVLAEHGERDADLIRWAVDRSDRDPVFRAVLDEATRRVRAHLGRDGVVAGGQRRDWIFSGPVARRLGRAHVSLYKQTPGASAESDRLILRLPDGGIGDPAILGGRTVVPLVDMLTAASSCWRRDPATGREMGWVPMLRSHGARVRHLVAVVSRRQGGEEALAAQGVRVLSCARVDTRFLMRFSRAPVETVPAYRDPEAWTRDYLGRSGVRPLVGYLVEDPRKLPRLLAFVKRYRAFLESSGLWQELDRECRSRLGRPLEPER